MKGKISIAPRNPGSRQTHQTQQQHQNRSQHTHLAHTHTAKHGLGHPQASQIQVPPPNGCWNRLPPSYGLWPGAGIGSTAPF